MTDLILDGLRLLCGAHPTREDGVCAMEGMRRRFERKVVRNGECWAWAGAKTPEGYGTIRNERGKTEKAHRVAWRLHVGEIPKGGGHHGMCVLHRCDNPWCVNPAHLFLGSNRDNAIDRQSKGRTKSLELGPKKNAARPTCPHGHPVNDANTGRRRTGSRYCRVCQAARSRANRKAAA